MMGFAIYEIGVGAGKLGLSPIPNGSFDVQQIIDWAPAFVVSLTQMHEGQTRTLEAEFAASGVARVHAPVVDYGVPQDAVSDTLDRIVGETVVALQAGGRVLFHCMGGCGRSGMAVLRVMHVLGINDPVDALRAVRPCAVETEAQMAWALRPLQCP
jgi:protein-tyrosine phosphatase